MRRLAARIDGSFPGAALALLFSAQVALAQPAENCTGADLTSAHTLPFNSSTFTPMTADFDLTVSACIPPPAPWPDSVVCFRPTNDCLVSFSCTAASAGIRAGARSGPCTTAAVACFAGGSSPGGSIQINNLNLTAGTNFCFICASATSTAHTWSIFEVDPQDDPCGALPVELMRFEVEG